MKDTILKFVKIFLILVAILLIVLLIFGLLYFLDWPFWVGFFLLLGLAGLGAGLVLLRKIWLRRREQRFAQKVIEEDEARWKSLAGKEKEELKDLQERWKKAVETLRRSHLRKYGNPLYVLPWYLVIGESGSGKTTAIRSARLSSTFAEVSRASGISGTRNCDWWFFQEAVILDTAGRYAIPVDEGRDKEEWQKFLNLLVKYRGKEPLNGLIVTLAADKLLQGSAGDLEEEGRNIRRRIDELMRALGTKVPVYVLVTKCDLVQGMAQFCSKLPEKSLDQAMGFVKEDRATGVGSFLDQAFSTIGGHLRRLRILLLPQTGLKVVDPGLFLFPEEFGHLRRGLEPFLDNTFRENPYQETPILRGLFFSSGKQEGTPYSHFLRDLGLIAEKEVLPGTDKGLFLHDFFGKILPKERGIFALTQRALEWRALTRNLGLVSWITVGIAVCGLLSFSFVKNLKALRDVSREFTKLPVLQGEILADLNTLDRYRQAVLRVEDQNLSWRVPRFGLDESLKVENVLKGKYCQKFKNGFLDPFDKQIGNTLAKMTASIPDESIGPYIAHLVGRIVLLKARLEEQSLEALQKRPQRSYEPPTGAMEPNTLSEMKKKFRNLYLYYLVWRSDSGEMNKEITILQSWLRHLMALKGGQLQWVVIWANGQDSLSPVTLRDFWGGGPVEKGEVTIAPAFTRRGKELVNSFIEEVEAALPESSILAKPKTDFEKWFQNSCLDAWFQFASHFPKGMDRLRGKKEWQQMAARMNTEQGPYFEFLTRLTLELANITGGESLPVWLKQVNEFQAAKDQGPIGGLLAKAAEEGKKLMAKGKKAKALESLFSTAKAYQEYLNALAGLAPIASSRNQAYQMACQVFGEDPATSKSPFFVAHGALNNLKTAILGSPSGEDCLGKLLAGPLDFWGAFLRMETGCHLQQQWEQMVLAETQGATTQQTGQMLLAPEGPVWKFVKGPASPFISYRVQKDYYAKEILGGTIPFEPSFFSFIKQSAAVKGAGTKTSYTLTVKGLPTAANPQAKLQPQSTRLELQCSSGAQTLVNYNYPVTKIFQWSVDTCSAVLFQIEVGNIFLKKIYQGLPEFLQNFPGGARNFLPGDFPGEKAALESLGIQYIKVGYAFSGEQPILGKFVTLPREAPGKIVRCWDQ